MGNTIGEVLISYDIDKSHVQVKRALELLGYRDSFKYKGDQKIYYLPETTLWHSEKSSNRAITDLQTISRNLKVKLEKAIAVNAKEFVGI